jgi:hypothetical protein
MNSINKISRQVMNTVSNHSGYFRTHFHWVSLILLITLNPFQTRSQTIFSEVNGYEPHFVLPENENLLIKSIKSFGAVGDGVTDDTKAFLDWLATGDRRIFIPEGTYLIKEQLRMTSGMKRLFMIGERNKTTIIKLADGSPGFDNPASPKSFIYTIAPGQQGEQNMHNYIQHLTIEIGKNNPGAIALNYHTNNTGAVKDVTIKATDPANHKGYRGIGIQDWGAGPGNLRYIEIEGFETGIFINQENHWTLEHINISNCITGVDNSKTASIRKLKTISCATGVRTSGPLALVDAELLSGNGENALVVQNNDVLITNLKTGGYAKAITSVNDNVVIGPAVTHWVAEPAQFLWEPDSVNKISLNLPIAESPEYQYPQTPDQWKVISSTGNITSALQEAIDNGAEFIYLQGGTISSTIYVRNKLKKIMVLGEGPITMNPGSTKPVFSIQDGTYPLVILEHIYENYGSSFSWMIEHDSPRTLVFRHGAGTYHSTGNAKNAKIFMESVVGAFEFTGVKAWLRDMDTERGGPDALNLTFNNATGWILGQKCEDFATKIKAENGSFCELLGGTYRQNWDQGDFTAAGLNSSNKVPLFLIDSSDASFGAFTSWGPNIAYDPVIREIRGTETRNLSRTTSKGALALYLGYKNRGEVAQKTSVTGIGITPVELTLLTGKTSLITAEIIPAIATDKKVIWESDVPSVAIVNSSGYVTGISAGTAVIKATANDGGFSALCHVTVTEFVQVTALQIIPESAVVIQGETKQLSVTVMPANASNRNVKWNSDKPDVVTVDASGLVTGVKPGKALITATSQSGTVTSSVEITVSTAATSGLYAYEGFNYTEGAIAGKSGGTGWGESWIGAGNINVPGFNYSGCESAGNSFSLLNSEATRKLTGSLGAPGSVIWIGFILHEAANSPAIHFQLRLNETVNMNLSRLAYDQWGLNRDGTGDPDNLPWVNEKSKHHFWLLKLVFGESLTNITVWQDPNLSVEPTSGGTTISIPTFTFNNIRLIQNYPGGSALSFFDEIRIGGNFKNAISNNPVTSAFTVMNSKENNLLSVYPTLTTGKFYVLFAEELLGGKIRIYSPAGREILESSADQNNKILDITGFPPGIYRVMVRNKQIQASKPIVIIKG